KGDSETAAGEECAGTSGQSSSISERAAVLDTAAEKHEAHAELNGDDMETELDVSGEAADLRGVQTDEQRAQRRRDIEDRLWRDRLRSVIDATDASEGDKDRVYEYWTGEYQLEFNETGEKCTDRRVLELLQRVLTPERVMQLSKSVKEKLATGLDEFNVVLVKQGGPELAKLFAESIAIEDYSVFFPSISRQLVAFILHELGVNTISVQILLEVQDQVMGAFKTAGGPTELAPMLRGEPIGGVESPLFSLPVAALIQRALENYVPGSPLPDRRELRVAALQLWYADDGALADAVEGIIQTAVDIMILLSEDILGLKVGHDAAEASKSASLSWTWDKSRNEFIRGDGNKFKVPLGSSREDIELARAISYRYLGIDFDPELDMTKVEESYRARASAIVTMINNLGGGSCDQLSLAINTVWQGIFIFPARTIPFTEKVAKALDAKATKVLCNHGNRLRHSKIVGAFISGKCGGLGLRPVQSTMAAGFIDERARAFGGRRGEPARAVQLAAHLAFAASLGWDGPSHEAPTAFDFVISERWLPFLRLDVPSECVALHLAKLGLNWRGTCVAECAADARRAAARGEQTATKVRLINMINVTPSLRLHGLGINSLDELHAGCGELLSAERIELIYARPGWVWSDIDKAHVRRLLREVAGDARAMVALGDWRERGVRMEGEIALTELINVGRRRALSMLSRIAGILWCKDAGGGRLDERSYEVIFCGARRRDAVWLTRAQVLEGAARRDAARRDATTAVSSCGASAEHVEPNETDEVIAWMDEADVSRWEPNTFNCFLHRLRGPARAAAFLAAAGRSAGIEPRAAAARIELIDLLLLDYAALRAKGVCAKEVNLREDRAADKAGKHAAGAHTTAWSATCAAELRRANGFENRVAAIRVLPAPRDADGAKFTDALVEARYDGVAWNNGRSNGSLWRGWRTAAHVPSHFERAPMAFACAVTRSFMRDREAECADEGALFANAYGEPLKVRIARDEAALIATDINLALMGEIGKIEVACVARGRGGFLLVAATDGAFVRAKTLSAREALRYAMASDEERSSLRLRAPYEPPQAEGARSAAELDSRLSKKVRALADTCAVQLLIREGVKVWQIFRRGREARTEIEELVFLVKEGPVSDDEMTGEGRAGRDARAMFEQAQRDLLCAVDGTASPELLEGRLFATPFFDFEGEGLDVTKGQQLFDRRIQGALSIQRGGGYGSQVELTRVGMRHILRNFAQSVLPELGEGVASSTPTEGETLPLCICPACHAECRCDFFHFFECASGISEAARSACCRALEQHATMLDVPSAEDGEGEGDLHLELAWARVALLAKRQPGELGRYRRYLAAKALCGAFAMPSAASVRAAAMADCWQCESSRQESTAEAAANDDDDELDELECEEARPRSEFDYMRLAEARRKFNKWYVARAIALNTVVIDHLRAEFGDWLGRMKRGHAGLRGAYGGDYQRHYTGGRGRVLDEQLCGMFYPANGSAGVPMSEADFDKGIAAELQPGRFVRVVGGETLVRTHGTADARREELRKKRDEGKERERLRAEEGRFKYARLEQERELGELLERRIERGFEGLSEPDEEESALLADGGRERALRLMREASAVGARAWLMPDGGEAMRAARAIGGADERADEGGVGVAPAHMDGDFDEMIVDDVAAPLLQATQLYGTVNEDIEEESEVDEAVRRAPFCQATQQHGVSLAGEDAVDDDDEAVQRFGRPIHDPRLPPVDATVSK
ncbi:hypothetical protein Ctob_004847, partial [Chrysochromulina tobinii]